MASSSNRGRKAGNTRVIVVDPEAGNEPETEERTEQEQAADAVIEEATAANPKAPEATIYRKDAETGVEKWVGKVSSSIVSHEWIAKRYGGGEFRVQHRKPNATGKLVYGSQETYLIDPSIQPERAAPEGAAAAFVTGDPNTRREAIMDAALMGLINQMQSNQSAALEMMKSFADSRRSAEPSKPLDIVAIITAVSALVGAIAPFFGNRKDAMETAKEIAELATKNAGHTGGVKDMITGLKELLEVKELLGGGGGGDDRSTGERLLEAALPKFMELADHYARSAPQPQQQPGAVVSAPRPAALPAGQPPTTEGPVWAAYVARQVPRWVKLAEMDKSPSLYAELEVDNLPPMFMGMLKTFLQRDDAIEIVLQSFPALAAYEQWSRDFFEEIISLVLGEDDEDEEDDGGGTPEPEPDAARRAVPPSGVADESGNSDSSGTTQHGGRKNRSRSRRGDGSDPAGTPPAE